ncbi:geranylgeranyl pyrophosphate synthetase [Xylaria bambusicola]|uniref:geranylgeranyl pyrophosphate synthetase n=1 Tax=Xylaria bambusicola TaxID=326684 RepID=UPI0020081D03|nr:geranylgeranyl pyrophosphate synthetase [Xylaria bambusicola]KAI0515081.1 geranylgeranyl pyrophosphate synthetase [Xylaria bambusicola]
MSSETRVQISRESLAAPGSEAARIENVKHLASYSWIESPVPTIAVPGIPPRWAPPTVPFRLPKDSGLVYIAQNAARHPESPLEPLFRSLYVTNPGFDIRPVDIITDRNNIRKLLSFINPSSSRNRLEVFTIIAEVVDGTMLMCRTETKTSEIIAPHEFKGYGHEFEKAYTRRQLKGSTGYHRIISYHFGGLNFVLRHEVDGYVSQSETSKVIQKEAETDGLSGLLGSLSLSAVNTTSPQPRSSTPSESKMIIREEGIVVPIDSTLEIKTCTSRRRLHIREIAPQLWVSQTPKLVRAYHSRGLFQDAKVEDVAKEIKTWELANQENLRKLVALVKAIFDAVKAWGGKAIIRYDEGSDSIIVTSEVSAERLLPEDLYLKWDDNEEKTAADQTEVSASS